MINKWLSQAAVFFLYLLSLLPLRILYLFSNFLFFILYHVIKYRRNVVITNLKNAFPNKNINELRAIEKKYFSYLSDLIFETIKMLSASPEYLKERYSFKNLELIRDYENQNKSFLFAVGHYGNWEWNTIVTPKVINALPLIIYKPLHNEVFDKAFKKAREKGGSVMVSMNNTMRKIIELKSQLTLTVFASDQTPVQNNQYAWMDFLNQPTAVYMGIEKIAKSTNYPVIFCDVRVLKRGYYSGEFINITSNPKETEPLEITKAHVKLLEKRINEEPTFWLWSHRRWKFKPISEDEIS